MKAKVFSVIFVLLVFSLVFSISYAQRIITIEEQFTSTQTIYPFESNQILYGLHANGQFALNTDTSYVRIVLVGRDQQEWLVYETNSLLSSQNNTTFTSDCFETCYLNGMVGDALKIVISNASLTLESLEIFTTYVENASVLQVNAKNAKDLANAAIINERNDTQKISWEAGITSFTQLFYQDKKKLFSRPELPFLSGFDYYLGGYFSILPYPPIPIATNDIVTNFDWRKRHLANIFGTPYYGGDGIGSGSGWIPPRWQGQSGATCYTFGPVYALQAITNLFFNQHLDINLAEQNVISCLNDGHTCHTGGNTYSAGQYIKNNGVVNEECFPLAACPPGSIAPLCSEICNDPYELIKPTGTIQFGANDSEKDLKERVILNGPSAVVIWPWGHAMSMVGFGQVKAGDLIMDGNHSHTGIQRYVEADSPDIGKTYWIFEQSWGDWLPGNTPYITVVADISSFLYTWDPSYPGTFNFTNPITSLNHQASEIPCYDRDGDGYYWWGIGPKSCNCPQNAPDIEDCNDWDANVGPYGSKYECTPICTFTNSPLHIYNYTLINYDKHFINDIIVEPNATLEVQSVVSFVSEARIIVKPGATLKINGGTLTSGCSNLWRGVEVWGTLSETQLPPSNQGLVVIQNFGSIENAQYGIITAKVDYSNGEQIDATTAGGIIWADKAKFMNNKVAISYIDYKFNNISYFHNCRFETTLDMLLGNEGPDYFVKLSGVTGIEILGCLFKNSSTNVFNGSGIFSLNSQFTVDKLCLNPIIYPCHDFKQSEFRNLYRGIYCLGLNDSRFFTVSNTLFDNNYSGIYFSAVDYAQILQNLINVPESNCGGPLAYGLYVENSKDYHIEANSFNTTTEYPAGNIGLYVLNSGPYYNLIYNNSFDKLSYGVIADGENRNNIYEGLCVKCNDFSLCDADVIVSTHGAHQGTDPHNLGIEYNQGTLIPENNAPAGNTFSDGSNLYYNIYNSGEYVIYVYHGINPTMYKIIPNPYSSNITVLSNNSATFQKAISCPSQIHSGGSDPGTLKSQMIIAENQKNVLQSLLNSTVDGGNTNQLANNISATLPPNAWELYLNLLDKSPYLSDTVLESAINKEEVLVNSMLRDILVDNPQSAKSEQVRNALNNKFYPLPEYMINQIQQGVNVLGAKEQLELQVSGLAQKHSEAYSKIVSIYKMDTLNAWAKDSLIQFLGQQPDLNSRYSLALLYLADNQFNSANSTLNEIPTTFVLNDNEQIKHEKYTEYFDLYAGLSSDSLGICHLDSTSLAVVEGLHQDTTILTGIYARNILIAAGLLNYQEVFNLPELEKSAPITKTNFPEIPNKLILSPNPANNYVIAQYEFSGNISNPTLDLVSLTGQVIATISLTDNKNSIVVRTGNFANGFYFLQIKNNNRTICSTKINIIH